MSGLMADEALKEIWFVDSRMGREYHHLCEDTFFILIHAIRLRISHETRSLY